MATERFTRWFQYNAFTPMFCAGREDCALQPWHLPDATQTVLTDYIHLRRRLRPYLRSITGNAGLENDHVMTRPLPFDSRNEEAIGDQFMFGPAFLVSPITILGATSRSVYLPAGPVWWNFWSGTNHAGGQRIQVPAPIHILPLFVKAGSIIPYGPVPPGDAPATAPIELRVYPGANGLFTLHEDDSSSGSSAGSTIRFRWDDSTGLLKIGRRRGPGSDTLRKRSFHIVFVRPNHGVGIPATLAAEQIVTYTGKALKIRRPLKKPAGDKPSPRTGDIPANWIALSPDTIPDSDIHRNPARHPPRRGPDRPARSLLIPFHS